MIYVQVGSINIQSEPVVIVMLSEIVYSGSLGSAATFCYLNAGDSSALSETFLVLSKPDYYLSCPLIDATHLGNHAVQLRKIELIDTDCVCP